MTHLRHVPSERHVDVWGRALLEEPKDSGQSSYKGGGENVGNPSYLDGFWFYPIVKEPKSAYEITSG